MRLRPGEPAFQVLLRDSRLADPGGLGAAGIVRVDEDTLLVGNFGSGAIHVVEGSPRVRGCARWSCPERWRIRTAWRWLRTAR